MATLQSLEVRPRSATTTPPPNVAEAARGRETDRRLPMHRLQGLPGRLPGVERPARRGGHQYRLLRQSARSDGEIVDGDAVLRGEEEDGNLEWLIRKDGCMHCADPGCLKACPAPGAIVQYANGIVDFVAENCIGCGYCVKGCPFNIPRISRSITRRYKCTLCSDRVAVGQSPACAKVCPTQAISFGTKEDMDRMGERAHRRPEERGYRECRAVRSAGRRRHPCDVRAAACRPAGDLCRPAEGSEDQRLGGGVEGLAEACRARRHRTHGAARPASTM